MQASLNISWLLWPKEPSVMQIFFEIFCCTETKLTFSTVADAIKMLLCATTLTHLDYVSSLNKQLNMCVTVNLKITNFLQKWCTNGITFFEDPHSDRVGVNFKLLERNLLYTHVQLFVC